MNKLNKKKIAGFILGNACVGTGVVFTSVLNVFALQGAAYIAASALSVVAGGFSLYLLSSWVTKENKNKKQEYGLYTNASDISNDNDLKQFTNKIDTHFIELKLLNDSIEDISVSDELFEISKIIRKIQTLLKDEKKSKSLNKINQAKQFFEYYMPVTVKILNAYKLIETNGITGENAMETKKQVCEVLPLIKGAFEKELDNMFVDEMLDITTDIKVLETMMVKDGLIDKNNILK